MSYDLMVFDPAKAPDDKASFMRWYGEQTKWSEAHTYSDIKGVRSSCNVFTKSLFRHFLL